MAISTLPFYFVLLEQYYTDEMNFPPINGVDEGSLFYFCMSMCSGYFGAMAFWGQEFVVFGNKVPLNMLLQGLLFTVIPIEAATGLYMIYKKSYKRHFKALWDKEYFGL